MQNNYQGWLFGIYTQFGPSSKYSYNKLDNSIFHKFD